MSCSDLAVYTAALRDGGLLSQEMHAEMFRYYPPASDQVGGDSSGPKVGAQRPAAAATARPRHHAMPPAMPRVADAAGGFLVPSPPSPGRPVHCPSNHPALGARDRVLPGHPAQHQRAVGAVVGARGRDARVFLQDALAGAARLRAVSKPLPPHSPCVRPLALWHRRPAASARWSAAGGVQLAGRWRRTWAGCTAGLWKGLPRGGFGVAASSCRP